MGELFQNVLAASFHGGIVIAVVLASRLALKKAPKKYICLLWLLAALRLLMPFEIESSLSLQPDLTPSAPAYVQQADIPVDPVVTDPMVPAIPDNQEYPEDVVIVTTPNAVHEEVIRVVDYNLIFAWIWVTVAAGMLVYSAVSYLRLRRRVGDAVVLSEGIWVSGEIESPFVMGFFRPRIYLSPCLGEKEREYVLAHEKCHIRRGDHWWKLLGFVALAVHWFNPLVWLGYGLLCRDLEMACDEAVVKGMAVAERKAYSAALLACSAKGRAIAACPVAFGEVSVKERIRNVLNYHKPKFWLILTAAMAVIVVAICFLTSPVQNSLLQLSGVSPREITGISFQSEVGLASISSEKELAEAVEALKEVRYDPNQKEVDYRPDDSESRYVILIVTDDRSAMLSFNEDFSNVWMDAENIHPVQNPEVLRALFEKSFNGVSQREASGEPFAAVEDVTAWVKGIRLDAVEETEYYRQTGHKGSGTWSTVSGVLREARLLEMLDALNALPEGAITETYTQKDASDFLETSGFADLSMHVTITDGVNDFVAMVVYSIDSYGRETLKIGISDNLNVFEECSRRFDVRWWFITDDTLCAVMRDFAEYPPVVQYIGNAFQSKWYTYAYCQNVTATGLQFCFAQYNDTSVTGELMYGQAYNLEKWDGTQWVAVSPIIENGAFTMEGILLPKNTTTVVDINWEWLYGEVADGQYRIGKDLWLDSECQTLYVYFGIGEGYGEIPTEETVKDLEEVTIAAVSGRVFTYEKPGIVGAFTITINADGTFSYYEGMASSYIGMGTWSVEGDVLILMDTGLQSYTRCFRFRVNNNHLYFLAEDSDDFIYVDVADGDRFVVSGGAAGEGDVRDQAFYEELFTRQTDGAYATTWIGHLYEAFYAEPEEFARQLSRKFSEDPRRVLEVLTCMSYGLQSYEPERFAEILKELRNVNGLPSEIIELLQDMYWEGEYYAVGSHSAVRVADAGQDYLAAALEGCEIMEGRHLQVSSGSKYRYTYVSCRVEADPYITELYRGQGTFDENTYAFNLYVTFVPENDEAYAYSMAGNTGEYTGDNPDVPEGALVYSRCGYVTWTEDGWQVQIVGTGW